MKKISPLYCKDFECIAGNCPDTCCAGWEIVIDKKFEELYRCHPSDAAKLATEAMYIDKDGDTCLKLKNGRCPMLTDDNLCRLYIDMGKDALCDVCRIYPRFNKDAEDICFSGISLSCPEATRLILGDNTCGELNEAPVFENHEEKFIFSVYESFVKICKEGNILFSLSLAQDIQDEIDFGDYDEAKRILENVPKNFEKTIKPASKALEDVKLLQSFDILKDEWKKTLQKLSCHLENAVANAEYNQKRETAIAKIATLKEIKNIGVYYMYKYLPEAMEFRDILTNVSTAVKCVEIICELCAMKTPDCTMPQFSDIAEFAKDFSKEVEHNGDNIEKFIS